MTTPRTDTHTGTAARNAAAAILARYPEGLALADLLARVCRDERIELLDADLWDIRGVLRHEGTGWCIYLSRQDAPARRLLTLAHLLGHYLLHADSGETFVAGGVASGGFR